MLIISEYVNGRGNSRKRYFRTRVFSWPGLFPYAFGLEENKQFTKVFNVVVQNIHSGLRC